MLLIGMLRELQETEQRGMAGNPFYRDLFRGRTSGSVSDRDADVSERELRGRIEFRVSFEVWETGRHRSWMLDNRPQFAEQIRDMIEGKLYTLMNSDDLVISLDEVECLDEPEKVI